ncbi:hypothetical protein [Paenibacillus mesotrionivorans]|uniref:Uncharacterized protein n=1 Tax=Paenibacillus mesotrionivorans TaxID=3160968 RepID=A0ACC7NX40_9BACL
MHEGDHGILDQVKHKKGQHSPKNGHDHGHDHKHDHDHDHDHKHPHHDHKKVSKEDNTKVMKVVAGIIVAVLIIGFAVWKMQG